MAQYATFDLAYGLPSTRGEGYRHGAAEGSASGAVWLALLLLSK